MAEPEDEDNFPNDYDGLDFDNIPELQAPTIRAPVRLADSRNVALFVAASPVPSNDSNSVEDMDPSFLAAVDALEARALMSEMTRDPGSASSSRSEIGGHPTVGKSTPSLELAHEGLNSNEILDSPQGEGTRSLDQARGHSTQSLEFSVDRKGKRKAKPHEDIDVRSILAGYETELTCPICCDLFVGAQVANPCGHTCCGQCSYGWLAQNKCEPTCALCRTGLSARKPLLPNFSVDKLVSEHLQVLAKSGLPEWQEKGYRRIEWNKRLESWKKQAAVRVAKEKPQERLRLRRRHRRYYPAEEYSYAAPWSIDQSMGEDEDAVVARVTTRRGNRSRH